MTVLWQSELFPKLQMTDEELEYLKKHFPEVDKFHPLLVQAERWLSVNPDRQPKRDWKRFFRNWVRNHIQFAERAKEAEKTFEKAGIPARY